jgi:MerR family transcriptional regulator, light-induced transcriptional regulator
LFTPEGEHHELPLLLIQFLMKKKGRHVIYAGANVPLHDLQYICKYKPVKELYFHLITYLHKDDPDAYINELAQAFPQTKITVSGPSTKLITKQPENVTLITSLEEMLNYAKG